MWEARRLLTTVVIALGILTAAVTGEAQPAGWDWVVPITVTENSGAAQTDYPVLVTLDTASLIAAGLMRADAGDLRFGSDAAGTSLLDYWIDGGVNTAATTVYVKVPSLPAGGQVTVYAYFGNPAATDASALTTFAGPFSATDQVSGGSTNNVSDCQRGFRFAPNLPILVTSFGKREPIGTTRYVTLFEVASQNIVHQQQVSGPAAAYTYAGVPNPFWLNAGAEYILELYQGSGDGYYYGTSSQINSHLTYYDMRYCNGCTQDTFPTLALSTYHYGYPDLEFYARKTVDPPPTASLVLPLSTTTLASDASPVPAGQTVVLTATVSGSGAQTPTGTVAFADGGSPIAGCQAQPLVNGVATCSTAFALPGVHPLTATYSGDAFNLGSVSSVFEQAVAGTPVPALGTWALLALACLVLALGVRRLS